MYECIDGPAERELTGKEASDARIAVQMRGTAVHDGPPYVCTYVRENSYRVARREATSRGIFGRSTRVEQVARRGGRSSSRSRVIAVGSARTSVDDRRERISCYVGHDVGRSHGVCSPPRCRGLPFGLPDEIWNARRDERSILTRSSRIIPTCLRASGRDI